MEICHGAICPKVLSVVEANFNRFDGDKKKLANKLRVKTLSQRRMKQFSKPWITKGIRASIKRKFKQYEKEVARDKWITKPSQKKL